MEIQIILQQLERNRGYFPKPAVLDAIQHQQEITPLLLQILEEVAADPAGYAKDADKMIHIYAMYLLAQFRETRAYPLLIKIFATPGEVAHDLTGDLVTEDFNRILASVSGGDTCGIKSLIENPKADEYVRGAALQSLLVLLAAGIFSREDLINYLGHLFFSLGRTPNQLWNTVATTCSNICAIEVKGALLWAFEKHLIEPGYIGWDDVQKDFAAGQEVAMARLKQRYTLITDIVEDMEWWACFKQERRTAAAPSPLSGFGFPKPVYRESPKVGRNDPCPCGSGKKFKKCCGA